MTTVVLPDDVPTKRGPVTKRELRMENAQLSAELARARRSLDTLDDTAQAVVALADDWARTMRTTTLQRRARVYLDRRGAMSAVVAAVFLAEVDRRQTKTDRSLQQIES